MKNRAVLVLFILLFSAAAAPKAPSPDRSLLKEGDIIFHESQGQQALAIRLATHSRYTHAGILFKYNGRFMVLEALNPVSITELDRFIGRGRNGHFVIKRLKKHDRLITPVALDKMKLVGKGFLGKYYDIYFEWDDKRIYCSELIWKIYKRALDVEVGGLQKMRDFDLTSPVVRAVMRQRYGNRIPLEEPVISPDAMFRADNLETVTEVNQ